MCAMVAFDVRPLNVALTWSVCAVGSSIAVAVPVAGVATGGTSLEPLRLPTNVMGTAGAGVDCSARAAKPSKPNERYFISASSLRLIDGVEHRLALPMLSRFVNRRNSIQTAAPVTSAAIRHGRPLSSHCCRFPHDKGWTAVDPKLTSRVARSSTDQLYGRFDDIGSPMRYPRV